MNLIGLRRPIGIRYLSKILINYRVEDSDPAGLWNLLTNMSLKPELNPVFFKGIRSILKLKRVLQVSVSVLSIQF